MSHGLQIDVANLEHKWGSQNVCADCGRDFDNLPDEDWDNPDAETIPLQIFRGKGKSTQMLVLCFKP